MRLNELNKQWEIVCSEYVKKFCNKQGIEFDGWCGDDVGGIAAFCDQYFFDLSDIVLDMNTRQPKGLILAWQSDGVDHNINNNNTEYINYKSYTMGLRYEQLKK